MDRLGALLLLLAIAPLMAVIALAVRLDSAGPVFFRQPRFGAGRSVVVVTKFRTMRPEGTDIGGRRQATRDDDRVTRVGRFLRKTCLDELPQLWDVLCGRMSLVGPRPHPLAPRGRRQADRDADPELPPAPRGAPGHHRPRPDPRQPRPGRRPRHGPRAGALRRRVHRGPLALARHPHPASRRWSSPSRRTAPTDVRACRAARVRRASLAPVSRDPSSRCHPAGAVAGFC